MKAKLYTKTIEVPEEIATGEDGPAWIKLRTRIRKKYLAILGQLVNSATGVMEMAKEQEASGKTGKEMTLEEARVVARFNEVNDILVLKAYANIVIDWNWVDDETGELLAKPQGNSTVFGELVEEQLTWIQEQIGQIRRYRATDGSKEDFLDSKTLSEAKDEPLPVG